MSIGSRISITIMSLFCTAVLSAQSTQPTTTTTSAIPRLVRINSTFHPANGSAASPTSDEQEAR